MIEILSLPNFLLNFSIILTFSLKSKGYDLDDVIKLAREIGFRVISIYTNGTLPIETLADTVFVSLDGLRETNNRLRGDTYDMVMQNIKDSTHPSIIINFTINKRNYTEIERFCNV